MDFNRDRFLVLSLVARSQAAGNRFKF